MTLIISETTMISDQSVHTARYVPERNAGDVSRPPGDIPHHNTAITAMPLPDTAADRGVYQGNRPWPDTQTWTAELVLIAPKSIVLASQPPSGINRQQDPASRQANLGAAD